MNSNSNRTLTINNIKPHYPMNKPTATPANPASSVEIGIPQILILDYGSQYTQLIARILREKLHIRSVILPPDKAATWVQQHESSVKAIILSGGPASINDPDAPQLPAAIRDLTLDNDDAIPLLGICYGMQLIAQTLGGAVESIHNKKEYGPANISGFASSTVLFRTIDTKPFRVWASHGDSVVKVPPGFIVSASSQEGSVICGMECFDRKIFCVQFHPEVEGTEFGDVILSNFTSFAMCNQDWKPENLIENICNEVLQVVGDDKVAIGFSGGVDSTTLARILVPKIGHRLLGIVIDAGNLREGELDLISAHANAIGLIIKIVDARKRFAEAFAHTTDAQEKRLIFKKLYVEIFEEEAGVFYGAKFIIQGTLATDLIESGSTGGAEIKIHHNANLKFKGLQQLHPLKELFKYEVRALAQELGLPERIWNRKPFPGPGLFIRIIGTPVTLEILDTLRHADKVTENILRKHGEYDRLSQLVVAYDGSKTVCIKGDERSYVGNIIVRGVITTDFMTAEGAFFSEAAVRELCSVLPQDSLVGRVFIDSTSKPPGPTEYE